MNNPDEGELDPATAAELDQAVTEHGMERAELDEVYKYRDRTIARETDRMRRDGADEARIKLMVDFGMAAPEWAWLKAMREGLSGPPG